MSECVCEEEDGRAAGGRAEAADTELKTKTPHVNVGKKAMKCCFAVVWNNAK